MNLCPSCQRPLEPEDRFCPACGRATAAGSGDRTLVDRDPSSLLGPADRFPPGSMLAGRYRIVALLGRGGMGEVYRAEDLKLGQAVALKFLPRGLEDDSTRLARLHEEVRLARQVSHPNVCRVYDIVEVEGKHFLSMEYVDGEDLASVLTRIGRLPVERTVSIARQICAGLAAAHAEGILHRDLKPANVMLDGRGRVRITDFGLASLATGAAAGSRAGTPAYMAPEQLAEGKTSVQSDLYALGLILYELATGKPAFTGDALQSRLRGERPRPEPPSSTVSGLDPVVEGVILRCLEDDPARRPPSALAVAAGLPGGDPLAAALAAGETPSPEMVAASGEAGRLRLPFAVACLVAILVGLPGLAYFSGRVSLLARVPMETPPTALAVEAGNMVRDLGYPDRPGDRIDGLLTDFDLLRYLERADSSNARWARLGSLRPGPIRFWYRQGPQPLVSWKPGAVPSPSDPPPVESGMIGLQTDPEGRLLEFTAVPPQRVPPDSAAAGADREMDWAPILSLAGLEPALLASALPEWNPLVDCDARTAWTGTYPDQTDLPVRVEAGSYRGKPVYFRVIAPWTHPDREPRPQSGTDRVMTALVILTFLAAVIVAALLARHNIRIGRGDRRGATRLALYILILGSLAGYLGQHHVVSWQELGQWLVTVAIFGLIAGIIWLLYVSFEPFARRHWPDLLISWNRLLAGRLRDPRVGRDVLLGGAAGIFLRGWLELGRLAGEWVSHLPAEPRWFFMDYLTGTRRLLSHAVGDQMTAILQATMLLFFLVLLRSVLRRQWAAIAVVVVFDTLMRTAGSSVPQVTWFFSAIEIAVLILVLVRWGFLAGILAAYFQAVPGNYPLSTDLTAWYVPQCALALLLAAALAVYAFRITLGGASPRYHGAPTA